MLVQNLIRVSFFRVSVRGSSTSRETSFTRFRKIGGLFHTNHLPLRRSTVTTSVNSSPKESRLILDIDSTKLYCTLGFLKGISRNKLSAILQKLLKGTLIKRS